MIELVVFDMAGTTVQAADQVAPAFVEVLSAFGLPISAEEVDRVRGASKREAIQNILLQYSPEQATQTVVEDLFQKFNANLARRQESDGVKPVEGAAEVMFNLRERKIKVALTTGFDRTSTDRVLAMVGWKSGVADVVVCADDVRGGRPAPYLIYHAMELTSTINVENVAAVGDTVLDLQAAANARVGLNVGVLTGAHKREQLEAQPHDHIIESVRELPSLIPDPSPLR